MTADESTPPLRNVPTGTSANDISLAACSSVSRMAGPQSTTVRSGSKLRPNTRTARSRGDSRTEFDFEPVPGGSLLAADQIDFGSGT